MPDPIFSETPQTSVFETLVGEGKKFSDSEALAKAKQESDAFIEHLKTEAAELREALNVQLDTRDVLERARTPKTVETPPVTTPTPAPTTSNEDLATRIKEALASQSREAQAKANANEVRQKLLDVFGDQTKAEEVMTRRAAELGVSLGFLQEVAVTSPKAFYAQLGLDGTSKSSVPSPSRSDVTPTAFTGGGPKTGTYAWYEALRKSDPKAYFDQKTQVQMHKDAMAAESRGEDF